MRKPQNLVGSRVSMELFYANDTLSPTWCQISMSAVGGIVLGKSSASHLEIGVDSLLSFVLLAFPVR